MSQDPNDPGAPQGGDQRPGWAQASPGNVPGEPPPAAPPGQGTYGTDPVGPYGTDPVGPYGIHADAPGAAPGAPSGYPAGYLPPAGKPRRFSGGYVVLGILACWAILVVPTGIAGGILSAVGSSTGGAVIAVAGLSLLAPLVLGGFLVGRGSPQRRGFGLGLFIGWGLAVVVGGGACVAIIVALSQSGA